jgi:hypothetical protein
MNMRLVRFTKGLLDILFYVGMAITVAIPVLFHYVGMYIEKFRTYYVVQCVLYMASGVLALLLVLELRRMFATVLADDAFVMENAVLKANGKIQLPHSLSVHSASFCGIYSGHSSDYYCIFNSGSFLFRALPGI